MVETHEYKQAKKQLKKNMKQYVHDYMWFSAQSLKDIEKSLNLKHMQLDGEGKAKRTQETQRGGEIWRNMTDVQKLPYRKMAEKDKAARDDELEFRLEGYLKSRDELWLNGPDWKTTREQNIKHWKPDSTTISINSKKLTVDQLKSQVKSHRKIFETESISQERFMAILEKLFENNTVKVEKEKSKSKSKKENIKTSSKTKSKSKKKSGGDDTDSDEEKTYSGNHKRKRTDDWNHESSDDE